MRIKLAATVALATVGALLSVGAAPAAAAESANIVALRYAENTNNVDTGGFVKTSGGVGLGYRCSHASGDISNTRVQLVSLNQKVGYRDFAATCDGTYHDLGELNAPSNTGMIARLHVYSNGRITGSVIASCWGYAL